MTKKSHKRLHFSSAIFFVSIWFGLGWFGSGWFGPVLSGYGWADDKAPNDQDNTMLMFVGEDLDVLFLASRREESAWQAPAVAGVISKSEIKKRGITTLSQALEMTPGFYMAHKEWGTLPYLRGIANSVLFLYDTVPLSSDITKSLHSIDHELSMAPVKRIEIIRGPGSVLWGPDAFAGIVNVVPLSGRDFQGVETGVLYGGPGDQKAFYMNFGCDTSAWNSFLSISGREGEEDDGNRANLVKFWDKGETVFLPGERFGSETPGPSRYLEAAGSFAFRDWFILSGRLSDYKRPYAMSLPGENLVWLEDRDISNSFVKLEAKKKLDRTSILRFTGSYYRLLPKYRVVNRTLKQREETGFGEMIYDRSFMAGRGLFTCGLSYREKSVKDAPLWGTYYLPDYLGPENKNFYVWTKGEDYRRSLFSIFGQYNYKIGNIDLTAGIRNDDHDKYRDHISYNAGVVWSPSSEWILKFLYGTACRTPFAGQLLDEKKPRLEKIDTLNIQASWKPSNAAGLSVCGFSSRIKNHIVKDAYAGLSKQNEQTIQGIEIEGYLSPASSLDFSANLTLLDNHGTKETYHYNDYSYIRPDGTFEQHFTDIKYPYDLGPSTLFNLAGTWRISGRITFFANLGYFSSRELLYPRSKVSHSSPGVWLLDLSTTFSDFLCSGMELSLNFKNITDRRYETPGTYSTIDGEPFSAEVVLRKKW